jgi:signal transduction histidine kinase/ActR/RegA family two-component response regulator
MKNTDTRPVISNTPSMDMTGSQQAGSLGRYSIPERQTPQQWSEEELRESEPPCRQSGTMAVVGRLAGGVAHELNKMFEVILGHTELALEQVDPSQPIFADLEEICRAVERSVGIIRQLLIFASKQSVTQRVLDLNVSLADTVKVLRHLISVSINLNWLPGAGLWQVKADPLQISQILANLCINAQDAIGDVGTISIETENRSCEKKIYTDHAGFLSGEYVRLSVSDNGCGMDKETLSHIFEPFFTTKDVGQGTGLGLAAVYGAVKQNDGFIDVHSVQGQGTTISIYLPRYVDKTGQIEKPDMANADSPRCKTVLLVEDEPMILEMTRTMFQRLGYYVLTANSPYEAIRQARNFDGKIHLLTTDVIMPEMNGRDLAVQLLASRPGMKCLFMSGYTANIITNQDMLDERMCFLQKPFTIDELMAKVREALDD